MILVLVACGVCPIALGVSVWAIRETLKFNKDAKGSYAELDLIRLDLRLLKIHNAWTDILSRRLQERSLQLEERSKRLR